MNWPGSPSPPITSPRAASTWESAPVGSRASTGRTAFLFPGVAARFDLLTEYVEILVRSWGAETFDFEGQHFVLQGQRALPGPVQKPAPAR